VFPVFVIFLIGAIAETNRAPFDLAEAESELVSGFMTEHAAVIFVFFFLAEYASIVLICIFLDIFFLGGYLIDTSLFIYMFEDIEEFRPYNENENIFQILVKAIIPTMILGIKASFMIFTFI
jgi:NADH-ubiquinone oxidoreductase chain 1